MGQWLGDVGQKNIQDQAHGFGPVVTEYLDDRCFDLWDVTLLVGGYALHLIYCLHAWAVGRLDWKI